MAYSDILNELRAKLGESKEENEKILKAVVGIQAVVILAIMSHIALVLF